MIAIFPTEAQGLLGAFLAADEWEQDRKRARRQRDVRAGMSYLAKAVQGGNVAAAMHILGLIQSHHNFSILHESIQEAKRALQTSVRTNPTAALIWGYFLQHGCLGVPQSTRTAVQIYEKVIEHRLASDSDISSACTYLGSFYAAGICNSTGEIEISANPRIARAYYNLVIAAGCDSAWEALREARLVENGNE